MPKTPKTSALSDTQLVILTTAAARDDGRIMPLAASLKKRGGALKRVLGTLLKAGLIEEQRSGVDDEVWRTDGNDVRLTLAITPAGLSAIGLDDGDPAVADPNVTRSKHRSAGPAKEPGLADEPRNRSGRSGKTDGSAKRRSESGVRRETDASAESAPIGHAPQSIRPGTKAAIVTAMLQTPEGASVAELMDATGWQAHSVRGFLSGTLKKKLGYAVASEKHDGARRYRIPA
jgi:Protein of unknown function (DUF3489)